MQAHVTERLGLKQARLLFWGAFIVCVATILIGRVWDANWHTAHLFDDFFSPPHVFIYLMSTLNTLLVIGLASVGNLRHWFGTTIRLPFGQIEFPGALALVAGGFIILAFAGLVLDNLWHSAFGLDETPWSVPHAMLGWSWMVIFLGFCACLFALYSPRIHNQAGSILLGIGILGFSAAPLLGPLYHYPNLEMVQAVANVPVFQIQPDAQHTFRIYLTWNLTRTHPLFIPLSTFWAGTALAMCWQIEPRNRIVITAAFFWTLITALGDWGSAQRFLSLPGQAIAPAFWLPLPILFAAIAVLLWRHYAPQSPHLTWYIAGWVYAGVAFVFWPQHPLSLILVGLAGPIMAAGASLSRAVYQILIHPTRNGVMALLASSMVIPLGLGTIDLYMRLTTP